MGSSNEIHAHNFGCPQPQVPTATGESRRTHTPRQQRRVSGQLLFLTLGLASASTIFTARRHRCRLLQTSGTARGGELLRRGWEPGFWAHRRCQAALSPGQQLNQSAGHPAHNGKLRNSRPQAAQPGQKLACTPSQQEGWVSCQAKAHSSPPRASQ